jgi:hypothetical protein
VAANIPAPCLLYTQSAGRLRACSPQGTRRPGAHRAHAEPRCRGVGQAPHAALYGSALSALVNSVTWFSSACALGLLTMALTTASLWLSVVVGAGVADAVVLGAGELVGRVVAVGDGVGLAGGVYLGMSLLGQAAVSRTNSAVSDGTASPSWLRYLRGQARERAPGVSLTERAARRSGRGSHCAWQPGAALHL